ncbi:MAG: hypothetical protein AB7F65_04130 [Dehalococcoidia bacterium]
MRHSGTIHRWLTVALASTLAIIVACGADAQPSPPPTAVPSETATAPMGTPTTTTSAEPVVTATAAGVSVRPQGTRYGIAGLVPPHFPESSDADWLAFFAALPGLGGTVGNYSQLGDLAENQEVGLAAGLDVLPVTGFHRDVDGGLEVAFDFSDPAQRDAFTRGLLAFVAEYRPDYLGVGNEVNRVWEESPEAFTAWVDALPELVAAVHQVSPGTRVFATFQYEFLLGRDLITGEQRAEDWSPLEQAAPYLDLVAFTSYPYFAAEDPAALPADYYAAIVEHTDRPVGFTELGWPSAPILPLVGSSLEGLGGTPEEQAEFIRRLGALVAPLSPEFMMWVWAYDTPAVGPTFESLGLSAADGTSKPAAEAWQTLAGIE